MKIIRRILQLLALCCASLTLYGIISLAQVEQDLSHGTAEVRILLDMPQQAPSLYVDIDSSEDDLSVNPSPEAEGILFFDKYEVAVFRGISEPILTKGAGRIISSAVPNTAGNCVLYGHRDSAFRFLPKLQPGDELQLYTRQGSKRYLVTEILIFQPEDPAIFEPTEGTTLSLVTCYPFTLVGPALQRCVVRAKAI